MLAGLADYIAYGIDALHFSIDDPKQAHFFNHLVYQATAATILSGAIAERVSLIGYVVLSIFVSGIVFSWAVRITWAGGFLAQLEIPFHDFAGSGVVHIVGGAAAFSGAFVVGPRYGRWDPARFDDFAPHDVKAVLSGVLILWCVEAVPRARAPMHHLRRCGTHAQHAPHAPYERAHARAAHTAIHADSPRQGRMVWLQPGVDGRHDDNPRR
jgi:hypothetical protein